MHPSIPGASLAMAAPKVSDELIAIVRRLAATDMGTRGIAEAVEVSPRTVGRILRGFYDAREEKGELPRERGALCGKTGHLDGEVCVACLALLYRAEHGEADFGGVELEPLRGPLPAAIVLDDHRRHSGADRGSDCTLHRFAPCEVGQCCRTITFLGRVAWQ